MPGNTYRHSRDLIEREKGGALNLVKAEQGLLGFCNLIQGALLPVAFAAGCDELEDEPLPWNDHTFLSCNAAKRSG